MNLIGEYFYRPATQQRYHLKATAVIAANRSKTDSLSLESDRDSYLNYSRADNLSVQIQTNSTTSRAPFHPDPQYLTQILTRQSPKSRKPHRDNSRGQA